MTRVPGSLRVESILGTPHDRHHLEATRLRAMGNDKDTTNHMRSRALHEEENTDTDSHPPPPRAISGQPSTNHRVAGRIPPAERTTRGPRHRSSQAERSPTSTSRRRDGDPRNRDQRLRTAPPTSKPSPATRNAPYHAPKTSTATPQPYPHFNNPPCLGNITRVDPELVVRLHASTYIRRGQGRRSDSQTATDAPLLPSLPAAHAKSPHARHARTGQPAVLDPPAKRQTSQATLIRLDPKG